MALRWMREGNRHANDLARIVPALLRIDGRKYFPVVQQFLFLDGNGTKRLDLIAETCGLEAIPEVERWMRGRCPDMKVYAGRVIDRLRRK